MVEEGEEQGSRKGKGSDRSAKKEGGGRKSKGSRPVIDVEDLPEGKRKVLYAYPIRSRSPDMRWYRKRDGTAVIKIRKRLTRFERKLRKVVGGPTSLRLPLDGPGSMIWEMADGTNSILEICNGVHREYQEEIEPVLPRVIKFVEMLLKRNLIMLRRADEKRDRLIARVRREEGGDETEEGDITVVEDGEVLIVDRDGEEE